MKKARLLAMLATGEGSRGELASELSVTLFVTGLGFSSCSCVFPFRSFCHGARDAVVSSEWQYGAMTKRADGQPAEKASRRKGFCIANYHESLDAEKRL